MAGKNGINMLDVKFRNRSAIVELIYQSGSLPRKEIAAALGLTPAAITLITNDLISEGILFESDTRTASRRGRREIMLKVSTSSYASIGVNITRHHYEIMLIDLKCKPLFHQRYRTPDEVSGSTELLNRIIGTIREEILDKDLLGKKKLIGIGFSILGIVDTASGTSVNSYGTLPRDTGIAGYFEKETGIPAILINNISACANGELFLSGFQSRNNLLFIKYGPGVGASMVSSQNVFDLAGYRAIEIGHMVMEPYGRPCVCGSRGCLETIISYNSITQSIADLVYPKDGGEILRHIAEDYTNSNLNTLLELYDEGNAGIEAEMNRVVYYLALAIRNSLTLLGPDAAILYGQIFENRKFRTRLVQEMKQNGIDDMVALSRYNLQLDALGPATCMISEFFSSGAKIRNIT